MAFNIKEVRKTSNVFGGALLNGNNPKCARPLDSKLPLHIVLRGIRGGMRTPRAYRGISEILKRAERRHGVKIYSQANVGSHLHLVVKLRHISAWAGFIRDIAGSIGLLLKGLKQLTQAGECYWAHRPFTRVIRGWGRAYVTIREYVHLNQLEANGFISRSETKTLKDLRSIWEDP